MAFCYLLQPEQTKRILDNCKAQLKMILGTAKNIRDTAEKRPAIHKTNISNDLGMQNMEEMKIDENENARLGKITEI